MNNFILAISIIVIISVFYYLKRKHKFKTVSNLTTSKPLNPDMSDKSFVSFSIKTLKENLKEVYTDDEKRHLVISNFERLKLKYVFDYGQVLLLNNIPETIEKIIKGWK